MARVPRMPSQSQMRSQMRSATRSIERQMNTEIQKATRKLDRDLQSSAAAGQRDLNRQVRAANRNQGSSSLTITTREQSVLEHWSGAAEDNRPVDLFLSHAWADRERSATTLHEALLAAGLSVWFSQVAIRLGEGLSRQFDKALANCAAGLVLVTPDFLAAVQNGTWADKELGVLLDSERVIPVLHNATFEDLKAVSPLLASRAGLSTQEDSFEKIAAKIAANF